VWKAPNPDLQLTRKLGQKAWKRPWNAPRPS